jgi:hypothetical protein
MILTPTNIKKAALTCRLNNRVTLIFSFVFFISLFSGVNTAFPIEKKTHSVTQVSKPSNTSINDKAPAPIVLLTKKEKAWLKSHPGIILGYVDSHEPNVIVNPDGSLSGVLVDLIMEVNKRLGTRIELKVFPLKELFEKAEKLHFSKKIISEFENRVSIIKVKDSLEGLQAVQNKEADVFIGVSHNSYLQVKYHLYGVDLKYVYSDFSTRVIMAIQNDQTTLVSILNKALATFSENEIKAMVAKWLPAMSEKKQINLTASEQAWLQAHQPIRLGYMAEYPPYLMTGEKSLQSGIFADLRNALIQTLGIEIVIEEFKRRARWNLKPVKALNL